MILNAKQAELKEVEGRLATLQQQFEEKTKEKNELEFQVDLCRKKLERAVKLIGGLGSEKDRWGFLLGFYSGDCMQLYFFAQRWSQAAKNLQGTYDNLTGDVLISSGVIAYLGAFTSAFRAECIKDWIKKCKVGCVMC